ncbi:helix-turn-helix domain-containing protein [Variovorax sp. J2P1-59]|uniref:helix-turn-helix domain-containing protein n=1 Tax=Variovorax flavidus TaxID=3053501 RepID=UPI002576CB9E|nr:helix-turn-helix domain-containing protein [Variovorax sp. J2P1-59]MDM0075352.1 helix-turn-helix domain-containing protein [Variovorax sp. J2P1-59]
MTTELLEPATQMEAEMAAVAHRCLVTALDHSKADHIDVTLDLDDESQTAPVLKLPPKALHLLAHVLRSMAARQPLMLVPQQAELTTQEAASFLNVSRPFVIKEIEEGRLRHRKVGRHRRIAFEDLLAYQVASRQKSRDALDELARVSQEAGFEF